MDKLCNRDVFVHFLNFTGTTGEVSPCKQSPREAEWGPGMPDCDGVTTRGPAQLKMYCTSLSYM